MKLKLLSIAVSSCLAGSLFSLPIYAASVPVITGHELGYDYLYRLNVTGVTIKFLDTGYFDLERSTDQMNYTRVVCKDNQMGVGYIDDQIQKGTTYWYQVRMSTQPVSCSSSANWSNFSSPYQVVIPPEIVKLMLYFPTNGKITGYVGNQIVNCGGTNSDCQFNAPINTPVILNATANNGYSFNDWISGCPTSSINNNCEFSLNQRTEMGVNFIAYATATNTTPPTQTTPPPVQTVQNTTDLTNGLVAYYCFDDPNNIGKDCSTNNNIGTPSGGVSAIANGVKGGAANFGGVKNAGHIRIPNSPLLQFDRYLTASFFVKLNTEEGMDGNGGTSPNGMHTIFSKDHDRSGFYSALVSSNGKVITGFTNNSYTQPAFGAGAEKPYSILQNWLHVAYVFSKDTGTSQMYFNGELVKEETGKTIDFSIANTRDLYLGKYSNYWYPLNGMLDEVRFYNRALSASEIKQLATIAEPPKFDLTVTKPLNGEVVAPNVACGSDCTESYAANTLITLLAKPEQGFIVDNWTGCNVSTDKQTCQITMDTAKTVGITFKASPVQPVITTTECDPVYNFQTESLGFYLAFPTQNALNGELTGNLETFKATLTHIYGILGSRFFVTELAPPNPLPKAECQAQFAIITTNNGSLKVHLPRVAIPKITSILGKTVYSGVELYQVTLTWNEADKNFSIESVSKLN